MEGLILLQDSREQRPLFKDKARKCCLIVGDYACMFSENYRHSTIFERKNCGDLFSTLSAGYNRFKREIEKAKENNIQLVILIEGTKERILRGYAHSQRNGKSIVLQLETIKERYGVDHIYFKSRIGMAKYIENFYKERYKEYLDKQSTVL